MITYDARVNFFEYADYTTEAEADYYHYSSYYGQSPQAQFPAGALLFNISIENNGAQTVVPKTNVIVVNPEGTEIYNEILDANSMTFTSKDTVDFVETVCEITAPIVGKYMVYFDSYVDGQEDSNPDDNKDTAYFYVSNTTFSREAFDITGSMTPKYWSDGGGDQDGVGTTYFVKYEGDLIHSVDVFLDAESSVGSQFYVELYYPSGVTTAPWEAAIATDIITIEESMLGTWVNLLFTDDYTIEFDETAVNPGIELLVGVKMLYGTGDVYIGESTTNNYSAFGTLWFFADATDPGWGAISNYSGGAAIRLNIGDHVPYDPTFVANSSNNEISIYPNPTFGTLNIENVEGANIEIINMMGQVIESIENANMINTVNMNNYSNGTYFVRVVNGNEVSTHKINLMK